MKKSARSESCSFSNLPKPPERFPKARPAAFSFDGVVELKRREPLILMHFEFTPTRFL
jgi:hypothetical protein